MSQNILSVADARDLTAKIRVTSEGLWDLLVVAYQWRAWTVLGYKTWDAYVQAEFGTLKIRIPKEDRREVVSNLRDHGLSLRAISAATGYDKHTVARDLAGGANAPVATAPPRPITGINGKRYSCPDSRSKFWKVAQDLCTMADKAAELAGNNSFGGHGEKNKEASLRDLHHARSVLDEVITKLEGASV